VATSSFPRLTASGHELDTAPEHFGELRSSIDLIDDVSSLKQRLAEDGYLYLPGYLDRDEVLEARAVITDRLAAEGALESGTPPIEAIVRAGVDFKFRPDLARENAPLDRLLYSGRNPTATASS
jgi:hypothetical protein